MVGGVPPKEKLGGFAAKIRKTRGYIAVRKHAVQVSGENFRPEERGLVRK